MPSNHALRFFERTDIPAKARVAMLLGQYYVLAYNSPSSTPAIEAIQLLNGRAADFPSFADKCAVFAVSRTRCRTSLSGRRSMSFHCTLGLLCTLPLPPAVERVLETVRCSQAVTSTGISCWAVDKRYGYGVVASRVRRERPCLPGPFSLTALVLCSNAFGCVASPPSAVGPTSGAS